jgi:UDP-N-acetyl-D-mannosaminuronic acid transferase (WecB/TagA/CpsF family)
MRLRVPDGGIVYGSRIAGTPLRGTVTGHLLSEALAVVLGPAAGFAFFGGKPGVLEEAGRVLENKARPHRCCAVAPDGLRRGFGRGR